MKRTAIFLSCLVFLIALMAGCTDKNASNGSLSTNPELAGTAALSTSDSTGVKTTTMILEEEDWDGVSPLESGKLYRITGLESIRKALSDQPDVLMHFEQLRAESESRMKSQAKQDLSRRELSRSEAYAMAQRLLADKPEVLRQVENILSEAKFPYKPALPEQEPQQPRKLKITMKESKTGVFSEENIVDKKKTENSETVLASNCAGATGNAIALCEHATDQGVNGWTTYPDKIRMMVGMDGYAWCLCTESIKWPYYLEVVTYPEYIVKYTYPFGSTYDYGVEIGVDAGLYDMNNNVTMQTQVGIRVYDWITQQHCLTIGDVESKNWPYVMKGDCDLDGVIDCTSDDLLLFLSFWNNTATPALGDQQYAADVDDNGTIDAYDLLALLQKIDQVC